MTVNDPGKLILLVIALIGGFVLAIVGSLVDDDTLSTGGVGISTAVLAYTYGNGRLAARAEAPTPPLTPTYERTELVHLDELRSLGPAGTQLARRVVHKRLGEL